MSLLEVISLRSAGSSERKQAVKVFNQLKMSQVVGGPSNIKMYRSALLECDVSIYIYWNSATSRQCKSTLGLQLVEVLKRFGLINHTVWMEEL